MKFLEISNVKFLESSENSQGNFSEISLFGMWKFHNGTLEIQEI